MNRGLFVAVALAIAIGVFFRFDRLDGKLYTNDEATTSVHVSGHTVAQYDAAVRAGQIERIGDLARFQRIDPRTSVRDVVSGLASEDPQHPPLFYVLERGWQRIFGDSIAARRALPALFGVVAIGCAYLFGMALIGSRSFALVLAALVALSPFHVLYAQQAREYSLWTALVFASSALLLRAVASPERKVVRFLPYAVVATAGLYTDVIFVYTLAAHALFVAIAFRRRPREIVVPFALAAGVAVLAFAPWIAVLLRGRDAITNNAYLGAALSAKLFALKWIFNVGAVFYDLDYERHATAIVLFPILALVLAGAIALARRRDRGATLFLVLLGATTALGFLVPDLVHRESRSTSSRYLIPTWIAFECAAAYALVTALESLRPRVRRAGAIAFAALAVCGVASLGVASQREYWWGDAGIAPMGPIARIVRAVAPPVTIAFVRDQGGYDFGPMLLADALDPNVRIAYLRHDEAFRPSRAPGAIFILDPSAASLVRLEREGWGPTLAYRPVTSDAAVAALRREAARHRARDRENDGTPSLWRLR